MSGRRANAHGRKFRDIIAGMIEGAGLNYRTGLVVRDASLWGKGDARVDILVESTRRHPHGFYVQCQYQGTTGTGFHKIPFEVARIKECFPLPAVIVVGGKYMQPTLPWLKRQVDGVCFLGAFDEREFSRALMRDLQ